MPCPHYCSVVVTLSVALISACAPIAPTAPPTTAPAATPFPEKEKAILQIVAESLCPAVPNNPFGSPRLTGDGRAFALACVPAAGHSTDVSIERFATIADAQSALAAVTPGQTRFDFHGYPAARWDEQRGGQKYRYQVCQMERWLVKIRSFDDTPYAIALDPARVAEALYQAAMQIGLFSK